MRTGPHGRAGAKVGIEEDRQCQVCGARLSRFNALRTCGPCQRAGKVTVDPAFWRNEEVERALKAWDLGLVSRGEFGEFLVAGEGCGEAEEGEEVAALAFVSDGEAAVAEQPGNGAFDLPAVPSESLGRLDAGAGDPDRDAAFAQPGAVFGGVVGLVRAEFSGLAAPWSASGPHRGYRPHKRFQGQDVVGVRRGGPDRERDALGVGQDVEFAAGFAAVDRVRAGQRTPLFARTDAASTITDVQSSAPRAPNSSSTARCRRRHSPAFVHTENRRCAVAGDTPNVGGRCRHAHPLVNT